MDKVYAQALALYRSGFRFWFEPDEIEQINQNNEKFRIISLEEQQLFKFFNPCGRDDATHLLSSSEILHIIFDENRNLINDVSLQRLGKILTANKFIKTRRSGRQLYYLKSKGQNGEGYPSQTRMDIDS